MLNVPHSQCAHCLALEGTTHVGALPPLPPGALAPLQGHCFCSRLLCECRSPHRTSAPLLPALKLIYTAAGRPVLPCSSLQLRSVCLLCKCREVLQAPGQINRRNCCQQMCPSSFFLL